MLTYNNLMKEWHIICAGFYEMLLECCLDDEKCMELHVKIIHHKLKLANRSHASATIL